MTRIGGLFFGYGGLDLAVQRVFPDAHLAWYSEFDKGANKIAAHRFPDVPNHGDITKIDWGQVEPVDILTGGSPCQDLSHAGKRAGMTEGTRSNLWVAMREAIAQLRPSLVVWENVRGAYSAEADSALEHCPGCMGDGRPGAVLRALGRVLGDLSDLGYDAGWHGLRAADVGAPHGRFRVFVVAYPQGDAGRLGYGDGAATANAGRLRGGTGRESAPGEATRGRTQSLPSISRGVDAGGPLHPVAAVLPQSALRTEDQKRIIDRADLEPTTDCWLWTGWTNQAPTPYGRVSIAGKKVYAHRASYEAFIGPIPEGHEVDHLCQTSLCVNPDHLEAVSPEENRDRVTQRRTHCKRGHEFTEENTYWVREGARACRTCRAWQDKVQKARRKGEEITLLPTPACNDMGAAYTPDEWDAWTDRMKAEHGNGNGHGKSLAIEAQRHHKANVEMRTIQIPTPQEWGEYAEAITRWEALTRPAPPPTMIGRKGNPQLAPAFVEWMMGLPAGHVTDVPGITRNEALKALGNGVVPQQAEAALRFLLGHSAAPAQGATVALLGTPTARDGKGSGQGERLAESARRGQVEAQVLLMGGER